MRKKERDGGREKEGERCEREKERERKREGKMRERCDYYFNILLSRNYRGLLSLSLF